MTTWHERAAWHDYLDLSLRTRLAQGALLGEDAS